MLGLLVSGFAFVLAYVTGRRSLVGGIKSVLVVGYLYGILRANLLDPYTYFAADAAVAGLFAAQLLKGFTPEARARAAGLRGWLLVLALWPTLLLLFPIQDPLVQLVGYRGSVFLLGFVILGARLTEADLYRLAIWCAWLNLAAFGFAVVEFFVGIEPFFPQNAATQIMYRSKVIVEGGQTSYRIPSSFSSAHAYGGTMVMTTPLILGAWVASRAQKLRRSVLEGRTVLLLAALFASMMGVFMSATRSHAALLFVLLIAATLSVRMKAAHRLGWLAVLIGVAFLVAQDARLQRFTTLGDEEFVLGRVNSSVNATFLDYAAEYPMGVGLGGGGTSMPYFLANRVRSVGVIESEYGRIMLEQGIPGLLLWLGFAIWVIGQGVQRRAEPWAIGHRLAWVAVASSLLTGFLGLGLFASVPQSYVFCLLIGWIVTARVRSPRRSTVPVYSPLAVPDPRPS